MPRFFFNHTSHETVSVDDSGTEFPSLEAAYLDTCDAILDMAFEKLRARQDPTDDTFEIISEHGDVLVCIPFSEVLRPHQFDDRSTIQTTPLLAISARLIERHQELKADLKEEFARTISAFQVIRTNLARLEAAGSALWPHR